MNFKFKIININLLLIIFSNLYFTPFLEAKNLENQNPEIVNNFKKEYLLGAGDQIFIYFVGLEIFSKEYIVQTSGYILLPEIGELYVEGLTLDELQNLLIKKYQENIFDPEITIQLTSFRPLKVTLRGEVNKTGLFTLNYEKKSNTTSDSLQKNPIAPRLFDLIKLADGITRNADLSDIQVTRFESISNGAGKKRANINLLKLLDEGDQSQNIILHDGDDILVKKNEKILLEQIIDINKSNLTPENIEVYIIGNVKNPGKIIIKQGLSIIEAISAAGGTENFTGKLEFIRLNRNGTSKKMLINYDKSALKGTTNNPILISGDIINVRKNIFGVTSGFILDYGNPIVNTYGLYRIFE